MHTTARLTVAVAEPPVHRSRADEVYEQLKRDVGEFKLVPGDRFTENEISERLGVSRTPVRQALFRMQQEGYVEVLFRSGWRVLPFDFEQFEQLYDLRMVLETTAAHRLCEDGLRIGGKSGKVDSTLLDELVAIWLVPAAQRSTDTVQVSQWDEAFHCALVAAAGNAEMARVHRDVTDRIRIIRRLDFTKQARRHLRRTRKNTQGDPAQTRRPSRDAASRPHRNQPGRSAKNHAASGAYGEAGWGALTKTSTRSTHRRCCKQLPHLRCSSCQQADATCGSHVSRSVRE
jgi:DNA-binding GntR family transcriptional regulator